MLFCAVKSQHTKNTIMKSIKFLITFLFFTLVVSAQDKTVFDLMHSSTNFHETVRLIDAYFVSHPPVEGADYSKNREWREYQRWKNDKRDKVMPDSTYVNRFIVTKNMKSFANKAKARSLAGWTSINQTSATGAYNGMGRATSVAIHPTNENIVYVGSQSGGIWKTIDGGLNYIPLTDNLPIPAAENIILDQIDPKNIYITLGKYGSGGIYKSTDEGLNWNPTGLTFTLNDGVDIPDVVMSPINNQILFAATSRGIYKTINGGNDWQVTIAGNYTSLCFKPGSGTVLYAALKGSPGKIMKSSNTGSTWTQVYTLPTNNPEMKIRVSAIDPNFVAISSQGQIFTSTNEGVTWVAKGIIPGAAGSIPTQLAVSPVNTNLMIGGYFENYRSNDGGATWTRISLYYSPNDLGLPGVHADIHDLFYAPSNPHKLYIANDGGMYIYNDQTGVFTERSNGLIITMFYDVKAAQLSPYVVIGGTQDNGGRKMNADGTWRATNGGDAMTQAIDPTNSNIFYSSYASNMYRTTDGWQTSVNITPSVNGVLLTNGSWELPYCLDPNNSSKIVAGYDAIWSSIDKGTTWTKTSSYNFGGSLEKIAMTKANSNIIFVSRSYNLYKSVDAGVNWTLTNMNTTLSGERISSILISPTNANVVWITCAGYAVGKKVFKSIDGGTTWTNISGTLPNVTAYRVIYEAGSNNRLYLGTDCGGIYFRDDTMADWAYYGDGLPNSEIRALDIRYTDRKLIVGTYGRGMWMGDLVDVAQTTTAPYCDFTAQNSTIKIGNSVSFNDLSTNTPTSWLWNFPGGTPSTSTLKSPTVQYPTVGTYDVSLTVTNAAGNTTKTKTAYISVSNTTNYSLDFDATNDYVSNASLFPNTQTQFTLEFWINPRSWKSWNNQIGLGWGKFLLHANGDGSISAGINSSATDRINSVAGVMSINKWNHIAFTYNAGTTFMYHNGVLVGQNSGGVAIAPAWNGFSIGNSGTSTIDGMLDELRIWNTARSQAQIQSNMNAEIANPLGEANLVAYYNFNSTTGATATDAKGTYNGTLINMDNTDWVASTVFESLATMPIAKFNASSVAINGGQTVTFTDISTGAPTSWEWAFEGGIPSTSTLQNPTVTYNTKGSYRVALTVKNANGSNTVVKDENIIVNSTLIPYTITSSISGSPNGTISPMGMIDVASGQSKTFTIIPDAGYEVDVVLIDGVSQGSITSYTFNNVTANHTISVSFKFPQALISPTAPSAIWSLVSVDSEESAGNALKAFDNNPLTYWHTQWSPVSPAYPHEIVINLGALYNLTGIGYLPRQDYPNGRIKDFDLYVSTDGNTWEYIRSATGTDDTIERAYGFQAVLAQYIKIIGRTACNGSNYAGAAEIRAYGSLNTNAPEIPKTNWSIKSVDSEQTGNPATNLIDGNTTTMWHTQYTPVLAVYPHEVQLDLGATYAISKFRYLPRTSGINGTIAGYSIYVSVDGISWGTPVSTGVWANSIAEKVVDFASKTGRYIKLVATSEVNGGSWASGNEVYAHGVFVGGNAPVANFSASSTVVTIGQAVTFTDLSSNSPRSWAWTTTGGTPASSTLKSPVISYSTFGTFDVSLSSTNGDGTSAVLTKANYITVSPVYCTSNSTNFTNDYIKTVKIGTFTKSSVGTTYSDYTANVIPLTMDASTTYTLTPKGTTRTEYWRVYIDYNHNGMFDSNELVVNVSGKTAKSGSFTVPTTALLGQTRMRVMQKYSTALTSPCDVFTYGEVEDYTVNITPPPAAVVSIDPTDTVDPSTPISIYAFGKDVKVDMQSVAKSKVIVTDLMGRELVVRELGSGLTTLRFNTTGVYIVRLFVDNKVITRKVQLF